MKLPKHLLLILVLCACSLSVHFIAEGLAPATGVPGFGLVHQGGRVHLVDGHCEDNFIPPSLNHLPVQHPAASPLSAVAGGTASLPLSPLLPPPNS